MYDVNTGEVLKEVSKSPMVQIKHLEYNPARRDLIVVYYLGQLVSHDD